MNTEPDDAIYGCDESIPGNCPCDDDDCGGDHPYEHICQGDEFHDGRHACCCGRNWAATQPTTREDHP